MYLKHTEISHKLDNPHMYNQEYIVLGRSKWSSEDGIKVAVTEIQGSSKVYEILKTVCVVYFTVQHKTFWSTEYLNT
jgi:hypothetical protein